MTLEENFMRRAVELARPLAVLQRLCAGALPRSPDRTGRASERACARVPRRVFRCAEAGRGHDPLRGTRGHRAHPRTDHKELIDRLHPLRIRRGDAQDADPHARNASGAEGRGRRRFRRDRIHPHL